MYGGGSRISSTSGSDMFSFLQGKRFQNEQPTLNNSQLYAILNFQQAQTIYRTVNERVENSATCPDIYLSVCQDRRIGPTQGQRKPLTMVGSSRVDHRCSNELSTRPDESGSWVLKKMVIKRSKVELCSLLQIIFACIRMQLKHYRKPDFIGSLASNFQT